MKKYTPDALVDEFWVTDDQLIVFDTDEKPEASTGLLTAWWNWVIDFFSILAIF